MKRNHFILCAILVLVTGCAEKRNRDEVIAKIGNYEITKIEFEDEFKNSPFSKDSSLESKKAFLDNLIDRKLILLDAQAKGLDKNKDFLKTVEKFWEQSLLKVALERKGSEIAGSVKVDDRDVKEAYDKMVRDEKIDKTYHQMYNQIRWEVTKSKETESMNNWLVELRKKSNAKINYEKIR